MNHKLFFSGLEIDLSKKPDQQIENALSIFYSPEIVKLECYKEVNDNTIEILIMRNYKGAAQNGIMGLVNYYDMSIVSGMDLSAFEPWGDPVIKPLIPWSDNMVYSPDKIFEDTYARQISEKVNEEIKRVKVFPSTYYLKITVEYA